MTDLTFFDAALKVLEDAGGRPLHYRDIARLAVERGLVQTSGLTPDATMGAILYSHIKQTAARGETPKIRSLGKGNFALAIGTPNPIESTVEHANRETRKRMLEYLHEMAPPAFEQLIGALLVQIGFENVEVTGRTGDGGMDVRAELTVGGITRVRTAVQVKRWNHNVPGKVVRELRGALTPDQRGLVITTSDFTKDAISEASSSAKVPISLIDGERLVALMAEHQIGVKTRELRYLVLDLEQFEIIEDPAPMPNRSLGLWPVPGGVRNYVESTAMMLRHIAAATPTLDQMIDWVKRTFERAKSPITIKGYVGVLRMLGLAAFDGENLVLTPEGTQCLSGDSRKTIAAQLRARVAGISEILVATQAKPMTKQEIHSLLVEKLGTTWETTQQTDYRLQWMENAGLLRKENGAYRAVPDLPP